MLYNHIQTKMHIQLYPQFWPETCINFGRFSLLDSPTGHPKRNSVDGKPSEIVKSLCSTFRIFSINDRHGDHPLNHSAISLPQYPLGCFWSQYIPIFVGSRI